MIAATSSLLLVSVTFCGAEFWNYIESKNEDGKNITMFTPVQALLNRNENAQLPVEMVPKDIPPVLFDNPETYFKDFEKKHKDTQEDPGDCHDSFANKQFSKDRNLFFSGVGLPRHRWKDGIVPFAFVYSEFTIEEALHIMKSMQFIMEKSCIKFTSYEPQQHTNYIIFTKDWQYGKGTCYSNAVGMKGGRQEVSLPGTFENYCFQPGSIVHELFHALGFWHEHTREDRDDFVEILWDNMHSNCKTQFEIQKPQMLVGEYDYKSAMHYKADACSKNGEPTIRAKRAPVGVNQKLMGSRDPSDMDILKLNQLYACGSEPSASPPSTLPPDEHPHNRTRLAFPSNAAGTATDAEMQEKLKICLNQATCSRRNRCCADMCHKNKQYLGEFKCSSLLGAIREFSCSCTSDRHANLD